MCNEKTALLKSDSHQIQSTNNKTEIHFLCPVHIRVSVKIINLVEKKQSSNALAGSSLIPSLVSAKNYKILCGKKKEHYITMYLYVYFSPDTSDLF